MLSLMQLVDKAKEYIPSTAKAKDLVQGREQFVARFPLGRLSDLQVEEYSSIYSKDTFIYWLERRKILAGIGGGNSSKFGIYCAKDGKYYRGYGDNKVLLEGEVLQREFNALKKYIIDAIEAAKAGRIPEINTDGELWDMVLLKILNIYTPENFFNIYSKAVLIQIAKDLGLDKKLSLKEISSVHINFEILNVLREIEPFSSWDNTVIGRFLWRTYKVESKKGLWLVGYSYGSNQPVIKSFLERGVIGTDFVGHYDFTGDLDLAQEDLEKKIDEIATENNEKKALLSFFRMRQGDYVALKSTYVKNKKTSMLKISAIGIVTENPDEGYRFDPELGHTFPVEWLDQEEVEHEGLGYMRNTVVNISKEDVAVRIFGKYLDDASITSGKKAEGEGDVLSLPVEIWLNLLQDEDIFKQSDLVYLLKMYELGGEATATRLASELGKHFSSFNAPIVHLAKRIIEVTNLTPPLRENGDVCYWCVLFEGDYEENGHFNWKLKPNLHSAIKALYGVPGENTNPNLYTKDDFLNEVFIDDTQYDTISNLLEYKRNIILQGPPGVGKTFVSKRLAYSLMGVKDETRIEMVQFHQNYAYEDFVMGYRPNENGFGLEYGIFYDFCVRALNQLKEKFFFIIDEINRGNLSKIFGELFMLIERDKRGESVTMGYSKEKFTVPNNVYLIGTMNTADRSLAQIEVALRRRFAFVSLTPAFNNKWKEMLQETGVSDTLVERILLTIEKLNKEIVSDYQLGSGYAIGHSFFAAKPDHMNENEWFEGIIRFEVKPLLEEYYYDRPEIVKSLFEGL